MATLFISDLHLDANAGVEMLRQCLAEFEDDDISDLYILGDLFEAWIGDDDDHPLGEQVAALLVKYADAGWTIHFLPGNRDFLVGNNYLARFGGQLLADPSVITLAGRRGVLIHGDRECVADVTYQAVRTQLRDPVWQQDFLSKSLEQRRLFAQQARAQSLEHTSQTTSAIMDADADEITQLIEQHDASVLIHGHTHRPAILAVSNQDHPALRLVLGAWHRGPSWLRVDEQGFRLLADGSTLQADWPPARVQS